MQTARSWEGAAQHLTLEMELAEEARPSGVASEMVSAVFAFTGSWLEPLAIELRVGCYDGELFTEGAIRPPHPFHLLVREPRMAEVRVDPIYRAQETNVSSVTCDAVRSWVDRALAQSCGDGARFETSLRELAVRASLVPLSPGWAVGDEMLLDCHAGTVRIPLERRGAAAWVPAPPVLHGIRQPVAISIENMDGWLRFSIDVYWSPWVEELERPESPLAQAIARLAARGWEPSSE